MSELLGSTHPDYGAAEKSFSSYLVGIVLCVVLTIIPFAAVKYASFSHTALLAIIFISATLQFLVQVVCFLRLNYSTEQSSWNSMSFIFTLVVLMIIIFGSLWIMWNLDYRMMH